MWPRGDGGGGKTQTCPRGTCELLSLYNAAIWVCSSQALYIARGLLAFAPLTSAEEGGGGAFVPLLPSPGNLTTAPPPPPPASNTALHKTLQSYNVCVASLISSVYAACPDPDHACYANKQVVMCSHVHVVLILVLMLFVCIMA